MRRYAAMVTVFGLAVWLAAAPASAQYSVKGTSDRATGETYHVELGYYFWDPTPNIAIQSESIPGIPGTPIDFVTDLGLEQKRFGQFKAVLRPSKKSKFRFEYTPIKYEAERVVTRNLVFNGILYPVSLNVATELDWKAYRFGYEWDMIYRDRGFFGLLFEAKYTDIESRLTNVLDTEFVRARAPIPAIGGIGRVYVAPNISITGELSGFPEGIINQVDEDSDGHYLDFDVYGSINFTDHAGAQIGYRSFDVFYKVNTTDEGQLTMKGWYFGGVVRF